MITSLDLAPSCQSYLAPNFVLYLIMLVAVMKKYYTT